jgi:hypothetical protein
MSSAEALEVARAVGIKVEVDGDDLVLEASMAPPKGVIDLLSRHKADIVALLNAADHSWSAEDWRVFFEERAGIAEFDGGLPRCQAEVCAFECCVAEWVIRNTARLPPSGLGCPDVALDGRCWPGWNTDRRVEAVSALMAIGIAPPTELPDDFGKNRGA